jgi:hypothetical protein
MKVEHAISEVLNSHEFLAYIPLSASTLGMLAYLKCKKRATEYLIITLKVIFLSVVNYKLIKSYFLFV